MRGREGERGGRDGWREAGRYVHARAEMMGLAGNAARDNERKV